MPGPEAERRAGSLSRAANERGEPFAWFEELYAGAGDASQIPWADGEPNPLLVEWAEREALAGGAERALVIGAGLGDDAEYLAARGFEVTGVDIAPSAVEMARRAHPGSAVEYLVGDAADPRADWRGTFAFVLEIYTLQAVPREVRAPLGAGIAATVAPGGRLLAIARGGEPGDPEVGPPYRLTRDELAGYFEPPLALAGIEDLVDGQDPPVRRLRALFERPA